jgi:hypothetical protein
VVAALGHGADFFHVTQNVTGLGFKKMTMTERMTAFLLF